MTINFKEYERMKSFLPKNLSSEEYEKEIIEIIERMEKDEKT